MSEEQLIDELLILILAGYETTGNSLAWLLYLLASNPEKMQKLLSGLEGAAIHDSVNNEYMKASINEGMRLFPAAWMTDRVAIEDDAFADYTYPKGTIVIPFFYGLHRDKTIWEDAVEFKPERFLPDQKAAKLKNFFPFGAGPRMCIGNNFAVAEMSFFLYEFLKEFQITPTEQMPQMQPLLTLHPDNIFLSIFRINRRT
jgi:cytochrome P450